LAGRSATCSFSFAFLPSLFATSSWRVTARKSSLSVPISILSRRLRATIASRKAKRVRRATCSRKAHVLDTIHFIKRKAQHQRPLDAVVACLLYITPLVISQSVVSSILTVVKYLFALLRPNRRADLGINPFARHGLSFVQLFVLSGRTLLLPAETLPRSRDRRSPLHAPAC
jgi:hypothetical protein